LLVFRNERVRLSDVKIKATLGGRPAELAQRVSNKQTTNPDNVILERQLDEAGRAGSVAEFR
jgi:hypothetical protein